MTSPLTNPAAIAERHDSVSFLLSAQGLADRLQDELKSAPDMPRALTRLAVDRGGPRDLGAIQRGLETAAAIEAKLSAEALPGELDAARRGDTMERLRLRSQVTEAETLLHPRGLGDFRVLVARPGSR